MGIIKRSKPRIYEATADNIGSIDEVERLWKVFSFSLEHLKKI